MGLLDTVQAGVATAFKVIGGTGGLVKDVTIVDTTASVYDPTTGTITETTETATVEALIASITVADQLKGAPQEATRKALIEAADLTWTPSTNSEVSWSGSRTFMVIKVDQDPSESLLILYLKVG